MSFILYRLIIFLYCCGVLICHNLCAVSSDKLIDALKPTGSITDRADLLSPPQEQKLRKMLNNLSTQTGAALVVVTLSSLEGGQIDDFTNRLFERWSVGQAGQDNGVMLLVAVKERKMRIEVGYGLEGVIPDGKAGEIRDTYILPYFKNGQMAAGIKSGTFALANLIAKHYKIEPPEKPSALSQSQQNNKWPLVIPIIIAVIIVSSIRGNHHNRRRYYGGSGWYVGRSGGHSRGGFGGGSSFGGFGGGMSGGGGASGSW